MSADPLDVNLGRMPAVAISAGRDFTCVVLSDGSRWCWGKDDVGQLGSGARPGPDGGVETLSEAPLAVPSGISTATASRLGSTRAPGAPRSRGAGLQRRGAARQGRGRRCAESLDVISARLRCRGSARATPSRCAFDSSGLRCWGRNHAGQVGDGAAVSVSSIAPTPSTVMLSGVIAVSAGGGTVASDVTAGATGMTCAHDGTAARCWGSNEWGELGDGTAFSAQPAVVTFTP
ncbi:MAG: RCC1 domain-containing protein [Polyangiales bacterium]